MFRRLYWIVEQFDGDTSRVTGVYTSIPDLVHRGLKPGLSIRLSIHKPDTYDTPLGQWTNDTFGEIADGLQTFVQTHEYSVEEVKTLSSAVAAL